MQFDPNKSETDQYKAAAKGAGICVLIPTYNNAGTLSKVIIDVLKYCDDVIVVNDGSTDGTSDLLEAIPGLQIIEYAPNKGKGVALRTGLTYAADKGYTYVISIDSDGQHFAKDIPTFLK